MHQFLPNGHAQLELRVQSNEISHTPELCLPAPQQACSGSAAQGNHRPSDWCGHPSLGKPEGRLAIEIELHVQKRKFSHTQSLPPASSTSRSQHSNSGKALTLISA